MADPYATLGLSKTATPDEIKKAYRKLAKKHHPDLNPGSSAAEKQFKAINSAYALLSDEKKRQQYDRGEIDENGQPKAPFGAAPNEGAAYGWGSQSRGPFYNETQREGGRYSRSFTDDIGPEIFEQIFGRGSARQSGPIRGEDQLFKLTIDFAEAIRGGEREIDLPTGKRLKIRIPGGIDSGQKLRFRAQGGAGINGGPSGDAYIEVTVRPSGSFRRSGDDIELEMPISLFDAVLGGEVRVPTVDGNVLLKIPPHSNTGTRLRIKNKGVYHENGRGGDQIVILKVVLPDVIDSRLEHTIREVSPRKEAA